MMAGSSPVTTAERSPLRVLLRAGDPVRRQGLAAMVTAAGHLVVSDTPDVVLCDLAHEAAPPAEAEAPVVVLTSQVMNGEEPAGVLPREISAAQLDPALRAVAAGLLVRVPGGLPPDGFRAASDEVPPSPLTPREAEILTLVGQGMSNKAVARQLGISVHTVKFHLEALFDKLDATSRAEAVAKGLRGGVIEF
jgi:two-component system, NarL family, nitrate/nitrite response regulator NarL